MFQTDKMATFLIPDSIIRKAQDIIAETVDINQCHLNEVMPLMDELRVISLTGLTESEESTPESKNESLNPTGKFLKRRSIISESSRKLLLQYATSTMRTAESAEDQRDKSIGFFTSSIYFDILKVTNSLPRQMEPTRESCKLMAFTSSSLFQNLIHEHLSAEVSVEDHYIINCNIELGKGTYGRVVEAVHRGSGERYACKIISIARMEPRQIFKLNAEVNAMRALSGHPNIVGLREVFYTNNFVFLIMDLCAGGELFNIVADGSRKCGTEEEIACMLSDMFSAVAFLHSSKLVHRDIKLENWMFATGNNRRSLKLIDFGLSKFLSNTEESMFQAVGSAYYVAPEVLLGSYDEACDVWSMGVIAYMMLSGTPPFYGRNDVEVRAKIIEGKYELSEEIFGNVSDQAIDFIKKVLVKNPRDRLTALEAKNHPFLKSAVQHSLTVGLPLLRKSQLLASLQGFCQFSDMKRLILNVATRKVGESILAMKEIEKSFQAVSGPFGIISFPDFSKALSGYAPSNEIEELFKKCNMFGQNGISYSEFLAATGWAYIQNKIEDNLLRAIFQLMDLDGRGFLSAKGIQKVLGNNCPIALAENILKEADWENSKVVYFAGFLRFWRKSCVGKSKKKKLSFSIFKKLESKKIKKRFVQSENE